jgi:cyclic pyranopterin phosphate synthase
MRRFDKQQPQDVATLTESPASIERDLRYVLTQKCNYQCSFCHKEWCDGSEKELLSPDDYEYLFATAKDALWINQVSLSGGEPMLCKNLWPINEQLKSHDAHITMVSNWSLLSINREALKDVDVLNVSLHTTNQDFFSTLTWSSVQVEDIIEEIITIQEEYPHIQIKINSAIIQDQNLPGSKDFIQKIELAKKHWWKLKYFELSDADIPWFVSVRTFEDMLISLWFSKVHNDARHNNYAKDGVEIITWRVFCSEAKETNDPQWYCKNFNDIYITPDGYLSSCPIDIKKFSAYNAIVTRNTDQLSKILQQTIANETQYACPFSS